MPESSAVNGASVNSAPGGGGKGAPPDRTGGLTWLARLPALFRIRSAPQHGGLSQKTAEAAPENRTGAVRERLEAPVRKNRAGSAANAPRALQAENPVSDMGGEPPDDEGKAYFRSAAGHYKELAAQLLSGTGGRRAAGRPDWIKTISAANGCYSQAAKYYQLAGAYRDAAVAYECCARAAEQCVDPPYRLMAFWLAFAARDHRRAGDAVSAVRCHNLSAGAYERCAEGPDYPHAAENFRYAAEHYAQAAVLQYDAGDSDAAAKPAQDAIENARRCYQCELINTPTSEIPRRLAIEASIDALGKLAA